MCTTISVDVAFLQEICVSLQSDPMALKLKNHSKIFVLGDDQAMEFQLCDFEVIDLEPPNHLVPCPWIHRSHGDEMP